mmetsp:Transcript_23337/g.35832  ORF Transcript_23337/g.35832 Transcript_23337/m.35832 type:complete len:84 (-) Transcript_23337:33-284(-)
MPTFCVQKNTIRWCNNKTKKKNTTTTTTWGMKRQEREAAREQNQNHDKIMYNGYMCVCSSSFKMSLLVVVGVLASKKSGRCKA